MTLPAERMRMLRERWRTRGLRELRLVVPAARLKLVRRQISAQVARLNPASEHDALAFVMGLAG